MDWDRDAEACSTLLQDATYALAERDGAKRQSTAATDAGARVRGCLTKADKLLEKLEKDLRSSEASAGASKFTPNEARRRRDVLRKLANERQRLKVAERAAPSSTDRDSLLGGGDGRQYGRETGATRDMTSEQMVQATMQETKHQDDILDNMSKGLDTLKTMGIAIRDETDLHMRLIDDIEVEVDKGNDNLKRETARAEHITRDTKTCWLYITICILLAVLVALVMVRWA